MGARGLRGAGWGCARTPIVGRASGVPAAPRGSVVAGESGGDGGDSVAVELSAVASLRTVCPVTFARSWKVTRNALPCPGRSRRIVRHRPPPEARSSLIAAAANDPTIAAALVRPSRLSANRR